MSSASALHRRLLDAEKNYAGSGEYLDAFKEYQVSNCYSPQKVPVYDAHTQTQRIIEVPCGRCYHCKETKINSWVTRMYAHAEDFRNVYFVTLTYRSITNKDRPVNKLLLSKLRDAVWHYDSFNKTSHVAYHPCVLCKSHYQNFLKRLRKYTGLDDITYVLSGEYGKDFGRPHFHMVLFTNGTITRDDIVRAWSVAIWRKDTGEYVFRRNHKKNGMAFNFPIGRVDFHDLVSNGTFNTTAKIRVDGNYMSAANCFSYVCKYVVKSDNANFNRVDMSYNAMFHKITIINTYEGEFQWSIIRNYLRDHGYPHEAIESQIKNVKKYKYEKNVFSPDPLLYSEGLEQFKKANLFGTECTLTLFPEFNKEYRDSFSPFVEFSRGCPIGSLYASRHLSEFSEGVFNCPPLQSSGFVVPSYFRRKASEHFYGLRVCSQTIKSKSYILGGLDDLLRRFKMALATGVPPREHFYTKDGLYTPEVYIHEDKYIDEEFRQGRVPVFSALRSPDHHFADLSTGTKVILCDLAAQFWSYNKHSRKYELLFMEDLWQFLDRWTYRIEQELELHAHRVAIAEQNAEHMKKSIELLLTKFPDPSGSSSFVDSCFPTTYFIDEYNNSYRSSLSIDPIHHLRTIVTKQFDDERVQRQKIYDELHKSVE